MAPATGPLQRCSFSGGRGQCEEGTVTWSPGRAAQVAESGRRRRNPRRGRSWGLPRAARESLPGFLDRWAPGRCSAASGNPQFSCVPALASSTRSPPSAEWAWKPLSVSPCSSSPCAVGFRPCSSRRQSGQHGGTWLGQLERWCGHSRPMSLSGRDTCSQGEACPSAGQSAAEGEQRPLLRGRREPPRRRQAGPRQPEPPPCGRE